MQRNMTAVDYNNRGVSYYNQGKLAEAIIDFTKAVQLDQDYVLNRYRVGGINYNNLIRALGEHSKLELFDAIKKLPNEKQIPLLTQCLDKHTELGKRFWKQEGLYEELFGCNTETNDLLKKIKENLSSLKCQPKISNIQMTMFQEKKNPRERISLDEPESAIGMHNTL